ncbi:Gmad2 immunoglobulin-like domain-containing protein [Ornithinibacillus halotolerans]|uniref:Bacterial spore germination immunoglobulin-like domain-containing protein n=1 Tax=Ornithinibacillus halotolerans TaxID=1274357 RepID=A0A916SDR2_9BACI|nr:Gmad2 immunoglobulin-like domain-containing protein [Ornithinibacillus halotolerans]GGA92465.1 hypothetical protein GCM10008025_38620 [Ornithinibacillus halotolerans]
MKKPYYLLLCFLAFISLVACTGQNDDNEADENNGVEAPNNEEPMEEENEESPDAGDEGDPSVGEEDSSDAEDNDSNEQAVYENEIFKDVAVSEMGDLYVVTGKAQVFEGVFQYKLQDEDDKVLLEDNYQTDGAPAWGDFEISIEKSLINTNNNVFLELFVYSAKDGEKINQLEIPIP